MSSGKKTALILIGGTIGNITEWYNFLLYGYLAPVIAQLFFPAKNELLSLTLVFTVFAISFLARPFGGILFGWIGDTYGRQRALILSLIMMGVPTFLIGLLPTYNQVGLLSPILLCLLRICQGLSAGGEHTGSAVYIAEYAPAKRRSLWVSIVPTSAALGVLISSLAALFLIDSFTQTQLLDWGWRVGYWIGAFACFISILLRIYMPETPYFKKIEREKSVNQHPISSLINNSEVFKNLLIVFGLAASQGVFYQILFIWMPTYLTKIQHLSNAVALQINSIYLFCLICLIVIVGFSADFIKRKIILSVSCMAMILLSYPLFGMLASGVLWQVYLAMGIFTVIFSLYLPTGIVCMVEAFHTDVRYTGLSFGFNLAMAIFGGTCPLIATWLIEITHNSLSPAFYLMLAAGVALFTTFHLADKRGHTIL